ncbi:MAG: GWxTD domain-containing protein, partial [Bacteroidetes bacterium]|nr:GWxTD domain-containing protein [Bacteroidota bacterium]
MTNWYNSRNEMEMDCRGSITTAGAAITIVQGRSASLKDRTRWLGRLALMLVLLTGFSWQQASAQMVTADFEVDVVTGRMDDGSGAPKVDIYTRVPITQMSFVNSATGFSAGYEVKLDAIVWSDDDRLRNLVQSRIWDASVTVNSYQETQLDDRHDFTTQTISLDPGKYLFEFEVSDRNSNRTYVRSVPVTVRPMNGDVSVSDVTLIESYDDTDFTIIPRVNARVGSDEGGFRVFYEVYSSQARDLDVTRVIRRTLMDGSLAEIPEDVPEGEIIDTDVVLTEEESIGVNTVKNQFIVTVPIEDFRVGAYSIELAVSDPLTGEVLDRTERQFVVEWNGLANHIEDIDDAIAQMEYIAEPRDLNFIKDAPNQVERIKRFENFWEKRDPTPGTRRNERMEAYYYRINAANRNYGAVREGWRTDRGFVLVRFGEPDHIRRKPHSFDYEPYEIWVFERIGRQFIFVDKTGFGDYQLPFNVWDERTRL